MTTGRRWLALFILGALTWRAGAADELERSFRHPPAQDQAWVYWWWLNGCVSKDGIVRDLDYMQAKGINGALVFQAGTGKTPWKTPFMSGPWREFFKFAVAEAAKRGIVIGLNLCSGWNAGGPWVTPEEAVQTLGFTVQKASGGQPLKLTLPKPVPKPAEDIDAHIRRAMVVNGGPGANSGGYYRDIAVIAWRTTGATGDEPTMCRKDSWVDLTDRLQGDQLAWTAPPGDWVVVRFGHHVGERAFTKCTGGGVYFEIDPLRADTMDKQFAATAAIVADDVSAYIGKTFQYVHIDSGEIGMPDWTPALRQEFTRRRGYDPLPYLAARAGLIVDNPEVTERFNEDYERTLGDLMVENYYGRLADLAHRRGLGTHSEAAGFQKPCVDALASLGVNDIAMSEFWTRHSETGDNLINQFTQPALGDPEVLLRNHDGIKTAAASAHVYGHRINQAEAFTEQHPRTTYPNWDKDPFALKDVGDRAFCAGANRFVLSEFVHQPEESSKPGYKWPSIGTDFDRHVTWSQVSQGWLAYLARCQSLLQAGDFVADACYFQGEWVPNYIPARWGMNPALPAGFDCDALDAAVLARAEITADGRLRLPGGMTYRYLVLNQGGRWRWPEHWIYPTIMGPNLGHREIALGLAISPATLTTIAHLVEAGLTLVGPPPERAIGLTDYPDSDRTVARLSAAIWGAHPAESGERKLGHGRVLWGEGLDEIFRSDGLAPELEIRESAESRALPLATLSGIPNPEGSFSWIQRRIGDTQVYFIANLRNARTAGEFTFRASEKQPELWDPVTGTTRDLPEFSATPDGRTQLPLRFEPRQSFFVVFRSSVAGSKSMAGRNFSDTSTLASLDGPWDVAFDPAWGGPAQIRFAALTDWTKRPEPGIKYYSGKATYRKSFDLPSSALSRQHSPMLLDLGTVKNVAAVRLNGQNLGLVWTAPWRVDITSAVRPADNHLEIDVVNLWPNRLIGDAALPIDQRRTATNVTAFRADMPLLPSGLMGPVTLVTPQP